MMQSYGKETHTYGRSKKCKAYAEKEEKIKELERLREEYLKTKREEKEKKQEQAGISAHVIGVDWVQTYSSHNAGKHKTDRFELLNFADPPLIIRRGQSFNILVRFKRQYDLKEDNIILQFTLGSHPKPHKGTLISLPISNKNSFTMPISEWDIYIQHEESHAMHLEIQISCKAAIGAWKLKIISSHPNVSESREYQLAKSIYVLFNPWCKEDSVYMESETDRNEYVLNDIGKLYMGEASRPSSRKWVYGQFSSVVLPTSMALLEKSTLDDIGRASPVNVARALSAMINSPNDEGVLEGRWTQPYDDGTAPNKWTGSTDILDKYLRSGYKAVKYGQCWVFAGLLTTVCRALGIPCRPVTNFISAHDTDATLTIDQYFTPTGERMEESEDTWNFHVWNDCWMTRPDLPHGYGGWQAVDSTPQETSEGIYQTGPASVQAVKRGEVGYRYDSPFVFAEVNADIIHWQNTFDKPHDWRKILINKHRVGSRLVTKRVGILDNYGENDLEDITKQYKGAEGTIEERLAIRNAASHGIYSATIFEMPRAGEEDVIFDMKEIEKVMIGKAFSITVHIENTSNDNRKVKAVLTADSVFYTGIKAHTIKHEVYELTLKPKQKEVLSMKVAAEEYYVKLVDYSMMKIYALASVEETKQVWAEEDDFVVEKPTLKLEVPQPVQVRKSSELSITLVNPLTRFLRNCVLSVEGPGLAEPYSFGVRDVPPQETIVQKVRFMPRSTGKKNLLIIFNSEELIDVQGSVEVEVI